MKVRFGLQKKTTRPVTHKRSFDIHLEQERPAVISLRAKEPSSYSLVYRDMRALAARNRKWIFSLTVLLVVGIAFGTYRVVTHANTAILYPSSCLGGWKNVTNAEGKPDLSLSDEVNNFSSENSAVLAADTSGEIFCGGFAGAIPPESKPTKILLSLVWTGGTPPTVITGDSFASSTQEILDSTGPAPDFKLTEPAERPPLDSGQPPAAAHVPSPTEEPAPPTPDVNPVSFLQTYMLLPIAYAQESTDPVTPPVEASPPETRTVPEASPSSEPVTSTAENSSSTVETPAAVDTVPHSSTNDFVEVRYTLNGTDWTSLGTFDTAHIAQSSFGIPVPSSAKWNDLSKLQISIRSIPSSDAKPVLYLDGMRLAIEFDPGDQKFYADKSAYSLANTITLTSVQPRSAVEIYSLADPTNFDEARNVYAAIVGDGGTVKLEADTLLPGYYVFINTTDRLECGAFSLKECRTAEGYIGEIQVTIVAREEDIPLHTASTSPPILPLASTTSDKVIPVETPAATTPDVVPLSKQTNENSATP